MAGKMDPEKAAAFQEKMAAARAAKRIAGASDEAQPEPVAPEPAVATYSRTDQIDADALAAPDPMEFDPNGVYVVMNSCIAMPYGDRGQWQEPVFHGDLVAAKPSADGKVRGLAAPELRSPADNGRLSQEATDGVEQLRRLFEKGAIAHPSAPAAREGRRNRLFADEIVQNASSSDRIGDPRLNIIASGGKVSGFASGELVSVPETAGARGH